MGIQEKVRLNIDRARTSIGKAILPKSEPEYYTPVRPYTGSSKAKLLLGVGGAAAIGLIGYGVYSGITNYVAGQTCSNNPGSPCYTYTQAYQTCLSQYLNANQQFLQADEKAGTGYTQEQLTYLQNLQKCMNNAAKNIYSTTKTLNLPITQAIEAITAAVIAILTVKALLNAYTKLKLANAQRVSGDDTAAAGRQALLQDMYDRGLISPQFASNISTDNTNLTSQDTASTDSFVSETADNLGLTEEEIASLDAATTASLDAVDSALADITDELAGLV